jgi:surface antigen
MKLSDKTFIVEDYAELSWAKVNAEDILTPNAITGTNVVFLLGFNDCLNSCTWKKINIDKIAEDYCEHVNSLIELFKEMTFYFCSVNPVTGPCPGTNYKGDLIPADVLNDAINRFNAKIKEKCKAIYIDSHSYLINTHFSTRDGIRFTQDTCESLLMFLVGCMKNEYTGTFTPRLTMPDFGPIANEEGDGDSDMINNYNLYLTSQGKYGGLNPYPPNNKYARFKGDTLPNCTAWAWGRFYEILGEKPNLALDYAERWWNYTKDGYKRGQTPALGAVICWQSGPTDDEEPTVEDGAGHVAIVEQINPDGSIIVSESGWEEEEYWWTTKRDSYGYWSNRTGKYIPTGDNTWGYIEFKFQGFIYCPVTVAVSKEEIRDINAWSAFSVDEEMKKNAQYIWQYFGSRGWSVNAVAALLGNLQSESGMSPSIWESVIEGSIINSDGTHSLNTPVLEEYKKNMDPRQNEYIANSIVVEKLFAFLKENNNIN